MSTFFVENLNDVGIGSLRAAIVAANADASGTPTFIRFNVWPVPGLEDTELGVFMEPEVGHGATAAYSGVQA